MTNLPARLALSPEILDKFFRVVDVSVLDGRLHIKIPADVTLEFDELEVITVAGNFCVDSVNGVLHLNKRKGTYLYGQSEGFKSPEDLREETQEKKLDAIIRALEKHGITLEDLDVGNNG